MTALVSEPAFEISQAIKCRSLQIVADLFNFRTKHLAGRHLFGMLCTLQLNGEQDVFHKME